MLSVTDFVPCKMNHFRGQSSSWPPFGHAGCWSIAKYAVSVLAGTSQVDFEVDCPPPAACLSTRRSFDHHGKGNGNFVKKKEIRKMKKSRISPWCERDEIANWLRDCLWLCQACKRGFTCRPMWRNLRQEAHSYPQADICSAPLSPS